MHGDGCPTCWAWKLVVLGILVLVWNWYITGMTQFFAKDWATFIGGLIVLKGVLHMANPTCNHTAAKKKK